jgi:hypothetical protein
LATRAAMLSADGISPYLIVGTCLAIQSEAPRELTGVQDAHEKDMENRDNR